MAKKFKVTIDGETYEVLVEELEETPVIKKISEVKEEKKPEPVVTPSTPSPQPKVEKKVPVYEEGKKLLTAPLPGKILKVLVSPGSRVKKGDLLLTIEAMKMENEFFASEDGVVKEIYVTPGQTVEIGGSLILLEVGS